MATLIVEDGSNVSGANTYITVAELDTYAADRGVTITAADEAAKGLLIIEAMDYIESLDYIGFKNQEDQSLQWARANVVIDSFLIPVNSIPKLLKDAEAEVALAIDQGESPLEQIERVTQREKVGSLEVEYSNNGQSTTLIRKIHAKLNKLLKSGSGGISFKVSR